MDAPPNAFKYHLSELQANRILWEFLKMNGAGGQMDEYPYMFIRGKHTKLAHGIIKAFGLIYKKLTINDDIQTPWEWSHMYRNM